MEASALLLSRIQFAATVSFHIIFPSFTIGLAAWLAVLEAMSMATGNIVYRRIFDYWRRSVSSTLGSPRAPPTDARKTRALWPSDAVRADSPGATAVDWAPS